MLVSAKTSGDGPQAQTLEYYERNADSYFKATCDADLSALYERFTRRIPKDARILDAGSGSGRDTLALLRRGYTVSAFDSSPALCELSTRLTGVRTRVLRFQELEDEEQYDGIWACASLLHVREVELPDAIARLVRALKPGGVLYTSFKHGAGERVTEDGRFFTDMTDSRLRRVLQALPGVKLEELWITTGEGQFQGQGEWLNALVSRQERGEAHG
ncbi:MAG: class I SAM-dependent methyltransferase [Hyphomicrobiales bacterium]|nr:class I SAM-dependent methyltransferase [Hyphomicrobiales bacterium]